MQKKNFIFFILLLVIILPANALATDKKDDNKKALDYLKENKQALAEKKSEIAELDKKIKELSEQRNTTAYQAEIINKQLKAIKQKLQKSLLELEQTKLTINVVEEKKEVTQKSIEELNESVIKRRSQLKQLIKLLYKKEQESFIKVFLSTGSLSEMLAERTATKKIQSKSMLVLQDIKEKIGELSQQEEKLEQQQSDLGKLQGMLQLQKQDLALKRKEKNKFLKVKKSEQVRYEQKIAAAEATRKEIKQDIFTLKNAGVKLKLTEAEDMARYASTLTGVRPALLLAVLKVETNIGGNIGNGTFPDDMHPTSRDPFLRITAKLGLDPYNTPISARPKSYSGWGGAMGPAQIMPQTWEGIESRLGSLLNKVQPDPYDLTDAFVGTALMLADRGAASSDKEYEAVNRYLAGPNWRRFTWYGDRVLAIAKEYENKGI